MRRADRLFQIVQYLRGGRLTTALKLADKLEVSERTIYRDIADLQSNGVPIDGEAGVGYIMRAGFDLPPLMFNRDEVAALVVGARMVQAWAGSRLSAGAAEALVKIEAVLPENERLASRALPIHSYDFRRTEEVRKRLDLIHEAVDGMNCLYCEYETPKGDVTKRTLEPLGLHYWGATWTLLAWCRIREDYRMFRVDRFIDIQKMDERFPKSPGKTLAEAMSIISARQGLEDPTSSQA
jgi:predicted DNA-binding transcriptional regulator YafY